MKAHWTPIIFAAGLGAGWLIFGDGMRESEVASENKSTAPVVRKREARPEKTPHEAKFRNFAKELPKLGDEDKDAFKKSLAPADRAVAIEAILAQAGPDGIHFSTMAMIAGILKTWAGEDFDGAWAWCRRIKSGANRKFVATDLLNALVDKDPGRALALHLEMVAENPNFFSNVPYSLIKQAATKDAASFLEVLGLIEKIPFDPFAENRGEAVDFAVDFDFQQAVDGVSARDGEAPNGFPTNFLSTWAERDADAAYAWLSTNEGGFFSQGFGSLFEGIEKRGVPGASYIWAVDKLNDSGTSRDAMIRELSRYVAPTIINSIAQAIPDIASRDRFLGDVVKASFWEDAAREHRDALTQMSTPEARLETLRQLGQINKLNAAEIPDAQLQQWGLTRQQVEQAQSFGR